MKYLFKEKFESNKYFKRNHTKKYHHKMNIISFLKSNYKYKRRSTRYVGGSYTRRQVQHVWRQQQTHPLPAVDASMSEHRHEVGILLRKTTKISKLPRIFITIKHPTDDATKTIRPCMGRYKRSVAVHHLGNALQADANEDNTDIASDTIDGACNEIHYQHSNYDKVSTITSTPLLRCHRQRHNQMKSSTAIARTATTTLLSSQSTLLVAVNKRSDRCFNTLRHNINNSDNDDNKNSNESPSPNTMGNNGKCSSIQTDAIPSNHNNNDNMFKSHINLTCRQSNQYVNIVDCNRNYTLSLLFTLFIAFAIGVRTTAAGACWQTVLGSGKCNDIFSFNMSKNECCGANQEFAYTEREPTSVEYFFATAIGGGMECTPCLESCRNVRCGPNKKCVKRKGRPKCVCAPECGAARRRRLEREHQLINQHHSAFSAARDDASEDEREDSYSLNSMRERSRQSRDTRSLSSEITTKQVNIGPEIQNQNQRKYIHIHMQEDYAHQQEAPPPKRKNQQTKGDRRLLLTTNVEQQTEKPTTRRIQLFSNVRTTFARRHFGKNKHKHSHKSHARHEDTDLSDDYEEEEDDIPPLAAARAGGNRNDDATRYPNQSLSRHKSRTNKNHRDHDLQTTKTQQLDQYSGHGNKSHSRQIQQSERHAENNSKGHRPNRHRHRHQDQDEHHHHRMHDALHQQHHINHQPNPNEGHSQPKHNKQHHKDHQNVQKHPKNHRNFDSSTSTTHTFTDSSHPSSSKASTSPSTTSQTHSMRQTTATPVNSTLYAGAATLDQSRYTSRGSKMSTSSSLPLSISYLSSSSSSSSSSSLPAASTLSYIQESSVTVSSAAASTLSSASLYDHAKGGGVSRQPHHRDHNGRQSVADSVTTDSYNDNDNTISSLHLSNAYQHQEQQQKQKHHQRQHQREEVILDSFFDQFNQYPKNQNGITITESMRPSNPVCGTDGRTYNTECQLRKRACRTDNPNLQIAYRGHCKTTCNAVQCMNGLTCVEDQYTMPHCIACKIECPLDDYGNNNDILDRSRVVCGADGKTYKSMCDINRIICQIGRSIGVAYPGPCRGNQITCEDINCGSKQTCLVDLLTHQPRCTPCRYKCSRKHRPTHLRFEEDKVCGVNNRTYNSWCEMRKDSCSTGFYIDVKYPGHCH